MPNTNIASATASDVTTAFANQASTTVVKTFEISAASTDGATGQKEYEYQNPNWSTYFGYYKTVPELKIAVDTKANWVMGNGYIASEPTVTILDRIRGSGKETFNSILENMERTSYIGGDSYAEIIKDEKDDTLLNLKPLDPSSIVVVHDAKGRILRYEQTSKTSKHKKIFKVEDIFVLSHNRVADEVHGSSVVEAVENIILARNEAMADWKRVLHRNIDPLFIFHLDTDDTTKIAAFKAKQDAARAAGENMYVPKGAVVPELVATATNASLNPLAWINQLNDYFFQAVGVPQIIVGNAKEFTDASGKIVYLAFEQRIKGRQKYVEEQVLQQLNLSIALNFPASLQNESLSDQPSPDEVLPPQQEPPQQASEPADKKVSEAGNGKK